MKENKLISFYKEMESKRTSPDFNLQDVLSQAEEMSKKLFNDLQNGTEQEKMEIQKMVLEFAEYINSELENQAKKLGFSIEELRTLVNNPRNFSSNDWSAIEKFKSEMENQQKANTVHAKSPAKIKRKINKNLMPV